MILWSVKNSVISSVIMDLHNLDIVFSRCRSVVGSGYCGQSLISALVQLLSFWEKNRLIETLVPINRFTLNSEKFPLPSGNFTEFPCNVSWYLCIVVDITILLTVSDTVDVSRNFPWICAWCRRAILFISFIALWTMPLFSASNSECVSYKTSCI